MIERNWIEKKKKSAKPNCNMNSERINEWKKNKVISKMNTCCCCYNIDRHESKKERKKKKTEGWETKQIPVHISDIYD